MPITVDRASEKYTMEVIYPVSISETDRMYAIKPAVLFNYMQDIAAKSIDRLGHQYCWDELYKKGRGWFLIRYRVEFDEYPVNIDSIKVQTENRGCNRMHAYRDFELFDNITNKRLLRATSSWFIVDLNSKSVVNLKQEYPEFFTFVPREDDLKLNKLKSIEAVDAEKMFHVRYDDLDFNNHVNNTVYITWAMEVLDYDFRVSHRLKTMDIYFKHEVKYGDDIISQVKYDKENMMTEHVIKNAETDEELCLIKAEYVAL